MILIPRIKKFLVPVIMSIFGCSLAQSAKAQVKQADMAYIVSMPNPATHIYHVALTYKNNTQELLDFKMSAWTPGFYEIIDFAAAVSNFHAATISGKELVVKKPDSSSWEVDTHKANVVTISYDVKATQPFIGNINLDENYGYIIPGALLVYLDEALKKPVTLKIEPNSNWKSFVATGMDSVAGKQNVFYAHNYDELYDSPLLMGKLQLLPTFYVKGIPNQFIGYNLGDFDHDAFISDLKKIVTSATNIIGDIPYSHYTFLAVGFNSNGFGGIEHLNSSSLLIGTKNLFTDTIKKERFYSFLAHEYFHLFNVKRIRPIELGPFDYSKENYTNMLWVSEGFTDYYENLILRGAGLVDKDYVLQGYREQIRNYENSTGHLYQTADQASHDIWAIRGKPTERTPEEVSRTINVYDKGCALGLMLDLKIRHESQNKHSLDDVMRALYKDYYQVKKRGFTEKEFQQECERMAGVQLNEVFEYASTTKPVNYPKYFAYAGLAIDTVNQQLPGAYMGATLGYRDSTLLVRDIEWQMPAMEAGLQIGDKIITVNGNKLNLKMFNALSAKMKKGDTLKLSIKRNDEVKELSVTLTDKFEKSFNITPLPNQTALQQAIYKNWLRL